MFCYYGYMTTPVVISQTALSHAVERAVSDVDAVRTGVRAAGVSDREVLEVLEAMLSLQRQVNGTVSVLMAVAEQRNASLGTANTPLESVLAASGQESVRQVRNQVFQAGVLAGRPRVHEAAAAGRITLGQARAIRDVVEGLPDALARSQKDQAEELLLVAADRLPAEKLRGMTDQILDQVAPTAKDTAEQRAAKTGVAGSAGDGAAVLPVRRAGGRVDRVPGVVAGRRWSPAKGPGGVDRRPRLSGGQRMLRTVRPWR